MEYVTLSNEDLLLLARDRLRGLESDHYRISLTSEPNKEQRLAQLKDDIENVAEVIDGLESKTAREAEKPALADKTIEELTDLAQERGVEVKASWKKQQIIDALTETDNGDH